jgi:hypothetical protein
VVVGSLDDLMEYFLEEQAQLVYLFSYSVIWFELVFLFANLQNFMIHVNSCQALKRHLLASFGDIHVLPCGHNLLNHAHVGFLFTLLSILFHSMLTMCI